MQDNSSIVMMKALEQEIEKFRIKAESAIEKKNVCINLICYTRNLIS